jgi:pyrroloquinoline quinone biosynthesis protein D
MTIRNVDTRPRRKDEIIAQQASNIVLLLNMDDGSYYSLNEVGGRVWDLCDGTRTVEQVVSALALEYDVPAQTLELDILELLDGLRSKNLIEE